MNEQPQKHLNIPLPQDLHRAAKVAAARQGVTLSVIVQNALQLLIAEQTGKRVRH